MTDTNTQPAADGSGGTTQVPDVVVRRTLEVVYHWDNGSDEVRYRRPYPSAEAHILHLGVLDLQRRAKAGGYHSPYSVRIVDA